MAAGRRWPVGPLCSASRSTTFGSRPVKKGRHRRFEEARKLKQQGPEAFLPAPATVATTHAAERRATTSSPTSPPSTARSTTTTKTTRTDLTPGAPRWCRSLRRRRRRAARSRPSAASLASSRSAPSVATRRRCRGDHGRPRRTDVDARHRRPRPRRPPSTAGHRGGRRRPPRPPPPPRATGRPGAAASPSTPTAGLGAWIDVFDWSVHLRPHARGPAGGRRRPTSTAWPPSACAPSTSSPPATTARRRRRRARPGHGRSSTGPTPTAWRWSAGTCRRWSDPAADRRQHRRRARAAASTGFGIDIESTARRRRGRAQPPGRRSSSADLRAAYPGEVLSRDRPAAGGHRGLRHLLGRLPVGRAGALLRRVAADGLLDQPHRSTRAGATPTPTRRPTSTCSARPTGRPDAVVHPVGGIGCCEGPTAPTTPADIDAMVQAAAERGALGASIYDYVTTRDDLWGPLQAANGL